MCLLFKYRIWVYILAVLLVLASLQILLLYQNVYAFLYRGEGQGDKTMGTIIMPWCAHAQARYTVVCLRVCVCRLLQLLRDQ